MCKDRTWIIKQIVWTDSKKNENEKERETKKTIEHTNLHYSLSETKNKNKYFDLRRKKEYGQEKLPIYIRTQNKNFVFFIIAQ